MPIMSDFIKSDKKYKHTVMCVGDTGTGKSYFASSYPDSYIIFTEPDSHQTIITAGNQDNVYCFEYALPETDQDIKDYSTIIESHIDKAKALYKEGKVKTLIIDNFTYLAHNYWLHILDFKKRYSKQGDIDNRAMYGDLKDALYRFMTMKVLTFPGNIVVTVHEQMEHDEVLAKKPDKSDPIVPQIMGSFRQEISGMFSAVLYLMVAQKDKEEPVYYALTSKMQQRRAKNRFGLPPVIRNPNYSTITQAIEKSLSSKG